MKNKKGEYILEGIIQEFPQKTNGSRVYKNSIIDEFIENSIIDEFIEAQRLKEIQKVKENRDNIINDLLDD